MPTASRSSTRNRLRCVAHQVERPRLRPGWRILLTALTVAAATVLIYLAEDAAFEALIGSEFAVTAGTRMSPKEEKAMDALIAWDRGRRAVDDAMYRELRAERAARAADRIAQRLVTLIGRAPAPPAPPAPSAAAPSDARR